MQPTAARRARHALLAGTGFLAVTAVPGGLMLLLDVNAPPVAMLRGSRFDSFAIPGLSLALLVGGLAILAFVLLWRRDRRGPVAAALAGLAVLIFEVIQVMIIGSPPGPARVMQVGYMGLGVLLLVLGVMLQRQEHKQSAPNHLS